MSGGTLPSSLYVLSDVLAEQTDAYDGLSATTRDQLYQLVRDLERTKKLVDAADRLLSGDIDEATFNFEWKSARGDSDD